MRTESCRDRPRAQQTVPGPGTTWNATAFQRVELGATVVRVITHAPGRAWPALVAAPGACTGERKDNGIMTGQFSGKVALVTGASKGIGLAAARQFAEAGASVVMSARSAAELDHEVAALRAEGHSVLGVTCDVSDRRRVDVMLARLSRNSPS